MDITRRSSGSGGFPDSSRVFNEFFYRSDVEQPSWMSHAADGSGHSSEDEEKLLDDVHARYISRTCSIDSTRTYSRTCSLETEEADPSDREMETEVVMRVALCCGKCENKVKTLTQMEGVTSVKCEWKAEKVTVIGTARPRDVLEACKKLFEHSKMWSPDDTLDDVDPAPHNVNFGLKV